MNSTSAERPFWRAYAMNKCFAIPPPRPTTQAAEGLPRWRWTVAEIERVAARGFFTDFDQFELLGGEIVPTMSLATRSHETVRIELAHHMAELARGDFLVAQKPQFNLCADTFVKPDVLVHPRAIKTYDLKSMEALLVVEVAETSLSYDLNVKLPIYASHGVREYWVINAITHMTRVHRQPAGNVYTDKEELPPAERLIPSLAPRLAVSLSELDLN
jgi:Uma2 family endonuclease